MAIASKNTIVSPAEAAAVIRSGDTIAVSWPSNGASWRRASPAT